MSDLLHIKIIGFFDFLSISAISWSAAVTPCFISVINSYEPDAIFAWGKPTYDNTPAYKRVELEPLQFENIIARRYEYTLDSGKKCVMINVHHPSCYFSYSQWHEIIKQALC